LACFYSNTNPFYVFGREYENSVLAIEED
jgi:hypothetical protein